MKFVPLDTKTTKQAMYEDDLLRNKVTGLRNEYPELEAFPHCSLTTGSYKSLDIIETLKLKPQFFIPFVYSDSYEKSGYDYNVASQLAKSEDFFVYTETYLTTGETYTIIFHKTENSLKEALDGGQNFPTKGVFKLGYLDNRMAMMPMETNGEEEPILSKDIGRDIQREITTFFESKQIYKDANISHKRGMILYGSPGNGKSSLIKGILRNNKQKLCVFIDCGTGYTNEHTMWMKKYSGIEKLIILEDIDSMNDQSRSELLNFLDGASSMENMFIIATTNNINKVDFAMVHRPSRFDTMFHFDNPDVDTRRKIIKRYFKDIGNSLLEEATKETKGFSGAYIKELFVLTKLKNVSIMEAVKYIKEQVDLFNEAEDKEYTG